MVGFALLLDSNTNVEAGTALVISSEAGALAYAFVFLFLMEDSGANC
jgi:hypothetical protein